MAVAISTEARAIHNTQHLPWELPVGGLTYFTPNINIFRDPRWGRGQETPGEDPCLTSRFVEAYVVGLQGDAKFDPTYDPKYPKVVATCKHYAAYSLENWNGTNRHAFDARVDARVWRESRPHQHAADEVLSGLGRDVSTCV